MGLEFNLDKIELLNKKLELAPRNQCRDYIIKNEGLCTLIKKSEFDDYFKKDYFSEGPFKDTFGDAPGEPYNPNRQAFGKMKTGLIVYCELSEAYQKLSEELI